MAALSILGDNNKPWKTIPFGDLTDDQVSDILKDNEKNISFPKPATADWVLDQILAREIRGIDCQFEREYAKHFFGNPNFTPKRGINLAKFAKPADSDLAARNRNVRTWAQTPTSRPRIDAKGSDGIPGPPAPRKSFLKPKTHVLPYKDESGEYSPEDVPF